jgi:hypothetical protein
MMYEYGEPRWNDIDRRKPKNSEENLPHNHIDGPGREPGAPQLEAGDYPPQPWPMHSLLYHCTAHMQPRK